MFLFEFQIASANIVKKALTVRKRPDFIIRNFHRFFPALRQNANFRTASSEAVLKFLPKSFMMDFSSLVTNDDADEK